MVLPDAAAGSCKIHHLKTDYPLHKETEESDAKSTLRCLESGLDRRDDGMRVEGIQLDEVRGWVGWGSFSSPRATRPSGSHDVRRACNATRFIRRPGNARHDASG